MRAAALFAVALVVCSLRLQADDVRPAKAGRSEPDAKLQLVDAVKAGNKAAALTLIQQKADVNAADQFADTPLMAAVRSGSLPIVRTLLSGGALETAMRNLVSSCMVFLHTTHGSVS